VRNISKSRDTFGPALLGAFTIFIPCGTTQAMMALAIASGHPLRGAGILYAFILGTVPLFFILGYFATKLGEFWNKKFLKVAAVAIILLAVFNLNNAWALTGSSTTLGTIAKASWCAIAYCGQTTPAEYAVATDNSPTITIDSFGYSPNQLNVKAGQDVNLTLVNKGGFSCVQAFTIPSLKIQKVVAPGSTAQVSFKAPSLPTKLAFMCSMGMYRGTINVIN
jgi:heme/copper-type cytochrome/quinol oxidase subunit 2